ncbi:hypothetical protein BB559_005081 [Furculomyces boomerangus]|uniref:Inositolphosphotransferase Aur1/Ipt1 domain-containing protein n=2 Tax=Harpellales TaxID=61421 RepID=A0A2T9YAY0_9FUNG|nr:hypothetical protein BB559_005081 [Furculomyces boomerangus]PWA00203.1 hypothetical protein BB558_003758 [Smittium angustum]
MFLLSPQNISSHKSSIFRALGFFTFEILILTAAFLSNFISAFFLKNFFEFDNLKRISIKNALMLVNSEKFLGIFVEQQIQQWSLKNIGAWTFWNSYYAGVHPVVTVTTLVFILVRALMWFLKHDNWIQINQQNSFQSLEYRKSSFSLLPKNLSPYQQYRLMRTTYVLSIFFTFLVFIFLPAMPPRLLPDCDFLNGSGKKLGACLSDFTFVDTIGKHGSLFFTWKDESVQSLSNPYAALPSQHAMFALWVSLSCFLILSSSKKSSPSFTFLSRRSFLLYCGSFFLMAFYPTLTIFCIIITANHYIMDAIIGALCLSLAYLIALYFIVSKNSNEKNYEVLPL